jgi:hypothetical protein
MGDIEAAAVHGVYDAAGEVTLFGEGAVYHLVVEFAALAAAFVF